MTKLRMTMADKIVVMYNGHIQQIDSPLNLYNKPVNKFVAGFIGSPPMNFINMKVAEEGGAVVVKHADFTIMPNDEQKAALKEFVGKEVTFGIRPEDISTDKGSANKIKATRCCWPPG